MYELKCHTRYTNSFEAYNLIEMYQNHFNITLDLIQVQTKRPLRYINQEIWAYIPFMGNH